MQDRFFNSFRLDDFTLNGLDVLNDYIIHNQKFKEDKIVYEGVIKDTNQLVKIYKRPFIDHPASRRRFSVLVEAFHKGIILADNIFLSYEKGNHYLYTIEPDCSSTQTKFTPLSRLLKGDRLDYQQKQKLFKNLLATLKNLHNLGEAHLEICPKNIWLDSQLSIRLKPFKLETSAHNIPIQNNQPILHSGTKKGILNKTKQGDNSKYWYIAPEQLLKKPTTYNGSNQFFSFEKSNSFNENSNNCASDMWSLGCIFAEMFVTLTPIFQSVSRFDTMTRIVEILGVPRKDDVYYMSQEIYRGLANHASQVHESPLLHQLQNLSKVEGQIMTSLLLYNPQKRPTASNLLELPLFKANIPQRHVKNQSSCVFQGIGGERINHQPILAPNPPKRAMSRECVSPMQTQTSFSKSVHSRKQSQTKEGNGRHRLLESRGGSLLNSSMLNQSDWWNQDLLGTPKCVDIVPEKKNNESNNWSKLLCSDFMQFTGKGKDITCTLEGTFLPKDFAQTKGKSFLKDTLEGTTFLPKDFNQTKGKSFLRDTMDMSEKENQFCGLARQAIKRRESIQNEEEYNCSGYTSFQQEAARHSRGLSNSPMPMVKNTPYKNSRVPSVNGSFVQERKKRDCDSSMECSSPPSKTPSKASNANRKGLTWTEVMNNEEFLNSGTLSTGNIKGEKAKLSIGIDMIKATEEDEIGGTYCCKVGMKSRCAENLNKTENIDLFSIFAPMVDRRVKLDFTGETELNIGSFFQIYGNEPLEIHVFRKDITEFTDDEDIIPEAISYGVCKVDLASVLPNISDLLGEGLPIKTLKDWHNLYDPTRNGKIVGQLKLEVSVEFTGQVEYIQPKVNEYPTPPLKQSYRTPDYKYNIDNSMCDNRDKEDFMKEIVLGGNIYSRSGKRIYSETENRPLSRPRSQAGCHTSHTVSKGVSFSGIDNMYAGEVSAFDIQERGVHRPKYSLSVKDAGFVRSRNIGKRGSQFYL